MSKPFLLILEGPDACGKTTLGQALAHNYNGEYFHLTYRFPNKMPQYQEVMLRKALKVMHEKQCPVVIDRLWVSEKLYADVYRGGSPWPLMGRYFTRLINRFAGIHLFCLPPNLETGIQWHADAKGERPEMYDDISEIIKAYVDVYVKFNAGWKLQHVREREPLMEKLSFVYAQGLKIYESTRDVVPDFQMDPDRYNLLGDFSRARFAFVGEALNNKGKRPTWPFWEHKHSSLFLTAALELIDFDERLAVWWNWQEAYEDPDQLCELLEYGAIHRLKYLALGKKAYNGLRAYGVPEEDVICIPHPSYFKRFVSHNYATYGQVIQAALRELKEDYACLQPMLPGSQP